MTIVYRFFTVLTLITFLATQSALASSINLFLRPAPGTVQRQVKNDLARLHKKSPSQIGKKLLKNGFKKFLPQLSGFVALYGGYVDYSDKNGNVVFPLLHKSKMIYLVLTPKVDLTLIHGNTISHKNVVEGVKAQMFRFEQKINENSIPYWAVDEETIPKHNRISPLSIVILTKPKNIVVPTGDFMATEHINLILPNLYVIGNQDNTKSLLDFLDIRRFFEQIAREEKTVKPTVNQSLIMNN